MIIKGNPENIKKAVEYWMSEGYDKDHAIRIVHMIYDIPIEEINAE